MKESKAENSVVLFGDADMLADDFSLRKMESPFGTMVSEMNANLNLAQNLVEQMAGDSNLIGVRSRATLSRPFMLVKKMEAEAEVQRPGENRGASAEPARDAAASERAAGAEEKIRTSASSCLPEQQAELENFRKKQAEIRRT